MKKLVLLAISAAAATFSHTASAQNTPLAGQWRVNMDVYQDGKITGEGNDMPVTACLLTIKQLENGAFEGTFSSSTLANRPTGLFENEPQIEYASECPVKGQRMIGQQYGANVLNAMQYDEGNNQKRWIFNGLLTSSNQVSGSFYGSDCFWGDYTWQRVGEQKMHWNAAAAGITPVADSKKAAKYNTAKIVPIKNPIKEPAEEPAKEVPERQNRAAKADPKEPIMTKPAAKTGANSPTISAKTPILPDGATVHRVVKGETMYGIAHGHKMTMAELKVLNNIPKDTVIVKIGQVLKVR